MKHTYKTTGTCSTQIDFELNDGKLHDVKFTNGCNGNLKSIGRLVEGLPAEQVIQTLKGVECGTKGTSCGDQLARACAQALQKEAQETIA